MKSLAFTAVLGASLLASGCATIVTGTTADLQVASTPEGAAVSTDRGQSCAATPCTLSAVNRGRPINVTFKKDGYADQTVAVTAKMGGPGAAWVWGNILIGGLIGLAVDFSTGAMMTLSPNPVSATLTPTAAPPETAPAEAAPAEAAPAPTAPTPPAS